MASHTTAFLTCAATAWTAAGYKLAALRHDPRNPALWALTACIVLPAFGFTMAVPEVYTTVNELLGTPNMASLLVYGCIVGYSVVALIMLMLWHLPTAEARRRGRRLLLFYAVVLTVMAVLFRRTGATVEHPDDFDLVYGPDRMGGTFLLVYVSAFGYGLATAAWRGRQFATRVAHTAPDRPWLARGLKLVAAGSFIALGYCLGKAVFVVGAWNGVRLLLLNEGATQCACAGAVVITAGLTLPSWGPRLTASTHWLGQVWTYLRLYPLWHTMYQAVPGIALDPPESRLADLLLLRDLDYRLYRRLVEIRDGRSALAPYMGPVVTGAERTARRYRLPVTAVEEALRIRGAVHLLRCPRHRVDAPPPSGATGPDLTGADDPAWLVQVARALDQLTVRAD
ncbi:MAB_1171c family putative transporter [Micromonospora sp. CPCC 206060]|uniref:MAB_1171c family putative transporter n=1 Tax=Micromonospora sp. CPCC 206060 TaxID=3122406 RepID=UPI002FF15B9E